MSTNARHGSVEPSNRVAVEHNRVVDVSDLRATRVREYALEARDAYLERKGGRTFLVTR